ncbi:WbqC family protein [Haloarchaeobius litoreus]|uniref:WbqC family protein n=1 Tax=Haloarchaeobius litoreus TaxID=755306 RepID=A0ABD6DIK3_9EURY
MIVQPLYLPWMGYFGYFSSADTMVLYDDIQFNRRSWQRRNRIKVPDGDFTYLTLPVVKNHGQEIRDVELNNDENWQESHWKSIHHSYAGAPYFDEYSERLETVYHQEWNRLVDLNTRIIEILADELVPSDTEVMLSSELDVTGSKTERLINILDAVDGDAYISGPAARDYLDTEPFADAGISLYWHEFDHPEYPQPHGEFVSHLSAIDVLFNMGPEARNLVQEGEEDALVRDPDT